MSDQPDTTPTAAAPATAPEASRPTLPPRLRQMPDLKPLMSLQPADVDAGTEAGAACSLDGSDC